MQLIASFAIGGFVPSAAIAGVLVLIGLGAFFYLGIKGPTDYWFKSKKLNFLNNNGSDFCPIYN